MAYVWLMKMVQFKSERQVVQWFLWPINLSLITKNPHLTGTPVREAARARKSVNSTNKWDSTL